MENMEQNADKVIYTEKFQYDIEPGGVGKTFFKKMKSYGDAIVQVDGYTGEKDTYSSLLQRCIRTAINMRIKGIQQGDIISICSYNHLNSVVPFVASFFIGAVSANLDPELPELDATRLIKLSKPKLIFAGTESVKLIENSLRRSAVDAEIVVFGESSEHLPFSQFLNHSTEEKTFVPVEVDLKSTAGICFSSGTSGHPKGICLSHLSILCQGMRSRDTGYNLEGFLGFSSFYWCTTFYIWSACILHKGYRIIVPTFDLNTVWNVLSDYKVSSMLIATYHVTILCRHGRPKNLRTRLEYIGVNGSYVNAQLRKDIKKTFPEAKFIPGYGLTEALGYCTYFKPNCPIDQELLRRKPVSDGRAIAGFTLKVVDPDTEELLGANQKGELRIKSDLLMNGYYNLDSASAWDSDGWLKTGDIVYYDDDKCFYIVDRLKEIMRVLQWTVLPAPIEEVIMTYPGVESAVVVGKYHDTDLEHPVGIVVIEKAFAGKIKAEDIKKYVEEKVDESKKLRGGVHIVQSLPITPTGKINRRVIRKMVNEGII